MSGTPDTALEQALALSHRLLEAADQSNFEQVTILDAERLSLLQSLRLQRDSMSEGARLMLRQVAELNERAIRLVDHRQRIKQRELDLAAVGRRAVSVYSTTR
ncbi:MAG: hypothetical protein ABJC66_13265 [Gammaproteobacteria bacterium]